MTIASQPQVSLDEFLKLPETEPASDFINGEIIQKLMPQGEHSLLQTTLLGVFPGQRVELYEGADKLPILQGIELELTAEQIFSWLSLT